VTGGSTFQKQSEERLARTSKKELIALIQRQSEEGQKLLQQSHEAAALLAIKEREIEERIKENANLKELYEELKQRHMIVEGQYILLKNKYFGKAKNKASTAARDKSKKKKNKSKPTRKLPSERYPDAPLIERHVELAQKPDCACCGTKMADSGMTEDSEYLSVVPAQFLVIRILRHKYRCGSCHGDIKTAPVPPRIKPGAILGDEITIDVGLSKYCDLIPIERYSSIAGRGGLKDLPHQTLIESTHNLADFLGGAYKITQEEVVTSKVIYGDETPHKMLEGDDKKNWRLWGFLSRQAVYFDIRDTRSGDIASELLVDSHCEYLMSDAYCGYGKAIRETNEKRKERGLRPIQCLYCNAHAIRKFKEANEALKDTPDPECEWFVKKYQKIYDLNEDSKDLHSEEVMKLRKEMGLLFEEMKQRAQEVQNSYPSKSHIGKALSYLLDYYEGLTLFTTTADLPIDNNVLERQLRNPVVGRKTWIGTHSKRGAKTAAILFTLVESCKLLKINPREYFRTLVQDLHQGKTPYSPHQFKMRQMAAK
jgi:transposase